MAKRNFIAELDRWIDWLYKFSYNRDTSTWQSELSLAINKFDWCKRFKKASSAELDRISNRLVQIACKDSEYWTQV